MVANESEGSIENPNMKMKNMKKKNKGKKENFKSNNGIASSFGRNVENVIKTSEAIAKIASIYSDEEATTQFQGLIKMIRSKTFKKKQ